MNNKYQVMEESLICITWFFKLCDNMFLVKRSKIINLVLICLMINLLTIISFIDTYVSAVQLKVYKAW